MTSKNQNKKNFMSQAEFSRFRGVSRATVTEYKKKGLLVLNDEGQVIVDASVLKLSNTLDTVRGGDRTGGANKPAASKDGGALTKAKVDETLVRTAKQGLELKKMAGELVERQQVESIAFSLSRQAQDSLIAIPDRMSSLLAAETDPAKVHDMLSDEIRRIANDLADHAERLFG